MNTQFQAKLLQTLANKKGNKGFTLIELLVVVIIIGVLAAIALPNLLGQVGKARESEAKSTIGAMTRAQQGYFTEKAAFASSKDLLEVPTGGEKYYFINIPSAGLQMAQGSESPTVLQNGDKANEKNGTRDYISGIAYDTLNRTFSNQVCRADNSKKATKYVLTATDAPTGTNGIADSAAVTCKSGTEQIK
ncbi:type IV pilin-like G/H family protein [Aphanothece sacrum]|uniref:Uncharacterized protein n=1 Tax=Aphanothece sacrum FPU1 TaxID=1920663 RepID=A0A401IJ58_APHSA|nr:type IV pilin-like G/H family protein [Aphanothece sacrum]GBF81333.1 hypothetical protein AsFPU1_2746 [Aphanothece sacrum FPU1]